MTSGLSSIFPSLDNFAPLKILNMKIQLRFWWHFLVLIGPWLVMSWIKVGVHRSDLADWESCMIVVVITSYERVITTAIIQLSQPAKSDLCTPTLIQLITSHGPINTNKCHQNLNWVFIFKILSGAKLSSDGKMEERPDVI